MRWFKNKVLNFSIRYTYIYKCKLNIHNDLQFQQTVQELQDLRSSFGVDVFISYCTQDIPNSEIDNSLHPRQVHDWLLEWGYSDFYSLNQQEIDSEDLILSLKSSSYTCTHIKYILETQLSDQKKKKSLVSQVKSRYFFLLIFSLLFL